MTETTTPAEITLGEETAQRLAAQVMLDAARGADELAIAAAINDEFGLGVLPEADVERLIDRIADLIEDADLTVDTQPAAPQTRLPAREAVTVRATGLTSPDPAQHARRSLLHYLATGCPSPQGMPDHADIPVLDLAVILSGLIGEPFEGKWDHVEDAAQTLAATLSEGRLGTTAEAYAESMLADALTACAPDREPTDG